MDVSKLHKLVNKISSILKCAIRGPTRLCSVGPLLFLININDIYNSSKKLSFYLFADDTSLLYKTRTSLENVTNIELQKFCDWLNANKLIINAKKSNFAIFRP